MFLPANFSYRLVFNEKRVLIEGGIHIGSFSIGKECSEKVAHSGKVFSKR